MSERVIYRNEGDNGVIEITEDQSLRALYLGSDAKQSCVDLRQPHRLILSYTRAMASCLLFCPAPKNVLLIGLGGGSLAGFLLHHFPQCSIDAVELRTDVIKLAHGYFALPEHPQLNIFPTDAQQFLDKHQGSCRQYDLILVDAFNCDGVAPTVKTPQFIRACRQRLKQHGIFTINLWDHPEENIARTVAIIAQVFANHLLTLPVNNRGNLVVHAAGEAETLQLTRRKQTAETLEQTMDMEFNLMLRRLKRSNRWRRLSELMASWVS